MTDKEIKDLAKQCSLYYQGHTGNKAYNLTNRLTIESYALMILKWLSDRYEIISKDKVREEFKYVSETVSESIAKHKPYQEAYFKGRKVELNTLFPNLKSE